MTDNEAICTAIVGGFTVLGAAIRLSVGALKGLVLRVVKAIDDATAATKETSKTLQLLVSDVAGLKQQLDIQKKIEQAVENVVDEVSGVHEAAEPELAPTGVVRRTPPGGYKRPRSRGV